ncbi:MAG TPA: hypothetical protein VHG09_02070 [Longimicrobiales bacterium]|nr:hypothetical protein [Longimicrobiales bacterium]
MKNETNAETRRSRTDKVKDTMGDAKETVQETASHIADEARDKTSHLAQEGREKAHEIGDKAQQIARTRAEEQKQRLTSGIRTFADALRRGCDDLSEDQNQFRPMLNTAADRVEGVSRYLEQRDVDTLTGDVRRFAREHTPLFIGGAFALGFAGARFLKSSPDHAQREQYGTGGRARYDRMLPEMGSLDDRAGTTESFQARTGTTGGRTGLSGPRTDMTEPRTGTTGLEGRTSTADRSTGATGGSTSTTDRSTGTSSFGADGSSRGGTYE